MAPPKGNKFWMARSSHGAKPKFAGPDELLSACMEYFEWVEANPLWEAKLVSYQGESKVEYVPKLRAMTLGSLCMFLDVNASTWAEWRANRHDLSDVITQVEQAIREQKFSGAAADLLNANIIARDLGLSDKSEITGKDGAPIIEAPTPEDTARRIAFLLQQGIQGPKEGTEK